MSYLSIFKDKFIWIIIIVTLLVLSNSPNNSFVWDDHAFIQNQNHSQFPQVSQIINGSYPVPNTGTYRPVRSLIYATTLNTLKNNPSSHHLLVLSIHIICSILVYILLKQISGKGLSAKIGSILFAIHPIHTENINWITAGYDLFFVVFYLLAIISHIHSRKNNSKNWLPYIFATLAFFSNEIALTLPLIIITIDYFIFHLSIKKKIYQKTYLIHAALAAIFWIFRMKYITYSPFETVIYDNLIQRFTLGLILLGKYITQIFLPFSSNVDHFIQTGLTGLYSQNHNLSHPPPEIQFLNPTILISLMISIVWISFTLISVYRKSKISLPLLWIPISLIAVLRVIPLPVVYSERYAYLASVGYVIFIVMILSSLEKTSYRLIISRILIILIMGFSIISYSRNKIWGNDYLLWSHVLKNNPESATATSSLGVEYFLMGDEIKSLEHHRKAAQMNPYMDSFQKNYISSLSKVKKYDEIIDFINLIIKTNSDNIDLYTILASTYDENGDYQNSMANYQKAYDLSIPESPDQKEIEKLVDILDKKYQIVDLK